MLLLPVPIQPAVLVFVLATVYVPGLVKQCIKLLQEIVSAPSPKVHVAVEHVADEVSVKATHSGTQPDKTFAEIKGVGCGSTETEMAVEIGGVPQSSDNVKMYDVLIAGVAMGLEIVVSLSPDEGDHM